MSKAKGQDVGLDTCGANSLWIAGKSARSLGFFPGSKRPNRSPAHTHASTHRQECSLHDPSHRTMIARATVCLAPWRCRRGHRLPMSPPPPSPPGKHSRVAADEAFDQAANAGPKLCAASFSDTWWCLWAKEMLLRPPQKIDSSHLPQRPPPLPHCCRSLLLTAKRCKSWAPASLRVTGGKSPHHTSPGTAGPQLTVAAAQRSHSTEKTGLPQATVSGRGTSRCILRSILRSSPRKHT
jgi:hypothetical protein